MKTCFNAQRTLLSSAIGSLLRAVIALALRRGAQCAGVLCAALYLARIAVRASSSSSSSTVDASTTSDVHDLGPLLMRLLKQVYVCNICEN